MKIAGPGFIALARAQSRTAFCSDNYDLGRGRPHSRRYDGDVFAAMLLATSPIVGTEDSTTVTARRDALCHRESYVDLIKLGP